MVRREAQGTGEGGKRLQRQKDGIKAGGGKLEELPHVHIHQDQQEQQRSLHRLRVAHETFASIHANRSIKHYTHRIRMGGGGTLLLLKEPAEAHGPTVGAGLDLVGTIVPTIGRRDSNIKNIDVSLFFFWIKNSRVSPTTRCERKGEWPGVKCDKEVTAIREKTSRFLLQTADNSPGRPKSIGIEG